MQHNKNFGCDSPVVQVGNVTFENEFKGANRANLVFMLTIETFE